MQHWHFERNPVYAFNPDDLPPLPPAKKPRVPRKPKVSQTELLPMVQVPPEVAAVQPAEIEEELPPGPMWLPPPQQQDPYAQAIPSPKSEDLGAVPVVKATRGIPEHVILVSGESRATGYYDRHATTDLDTCQRLIEQQMRAVQDQGATGEVTVMLVMRRQSRNILRLSFSGEGWYNITADLNVWLRYGTYRERQGA